MMETIDEKLKSALDTMKKALSEGEKARFKDFWRTKKDLLELFKEEMHPTKRSLYWSEYTALLKEAHELQKILDEQMNFEIEQILLAIDSLEAEVKDREDRIERMQVEAGLERILREPLFLMRKQIAFYSICQDKILSLRKEVLDLEMRVSQKNKMLSRLGEMGDIVFPEKKKLLPEFSKAFANEMEERPPFRKDRIKQCQRLLKSLPLTNETYRKVRQQLSDAWDSSDKEEQGRREELLRTQQEEKEKSLKIANAIEALEALAGKANKMKVDNLQSELESHEAPLLQSSLSKRDRITVKHSTLIIKEAILTKQEDNEALAELSTETEKLIQLMRNEMKNCGLDIEFAMKLKELISVHKERLETLAVH